MITGVEGRIGGPAQAGRPISRGAGRPPVRVATPAGNKAYIGNTLRQLRLTLMKASGVAGHLRTIHFALVVVALRGIEDSRLGQESPHDGISARIALLEGRLE